MGRQLETDDKRKGPIVVARVMARFGEIARSLADLERLSRHLVWVTGGLLDAAGLHV
jgi:hypothetical protein